MLTLIYDNDSFRLYSTIPVLFTTQKSTGRRGNGESIDGTVLDRCWWSTAKAITLRIGLILCTGSREGMVKNNIRRSIQKKVRCVGWGMTMYAPLRMSALEMVGTSTISSTGFPVGSVCRDRRVYVSGYASLELCKKEAGTI